MKNKIKNTLALVVLSQLYTGAFGIEKACKVSSADDITYSVNKLEKLAEQYEFLVQESSKTDKMMQGYLKDIESFNVESSSAAESFIEDVISNVQKNKAYLGKK